ncbi:MAG TPA: hypothetical protein VM841_11470 [Actinomycetota bacterium]|nr:hypothetical protein [Actinomycetota bacterium]
MRIRDLGLIAVVLAFTAPLPPASGAFDSKPPPPSMSVATATLAAPSSSSATNGACVVATSRIVNVSWSQTTSSFADGYLVQRATSASGPFSNVATITSHATTVWADSGVAASTTYHYRVLATKLAWRSAASPVSSVTTPSLLCVL